MMRECVQCGFCCEKGPCAFGEWDYQAKRCRFLKDLSDGRSICSEYDRIKNMPGASGNPAFGAGCCMPLFNTKRESTICSIQSVSVSSGRSCEVDSLQHNVRAFDLQRKGSCQKARHFGC